MRVQICNWELADCHTNDTHAGCVATYQAAGLCQCCCTAGLPPWAGQLDGLMGSNAVEKQATLTKLNRLSRLPQDATQDVATVCS